MINKIINYLGAYPTAGIDFRLFRMLNARGFTFVFSLASLFFSAYPSSFSGLLTILDSSVFLLETVSIEVVLLSTALKTIFIIIIHA